LAGWQSPGRIHPHIDPTGDVQLLHVSNSPESPKVSPVTLKGVVKVCQNRIYEVVVDIPRR